MNTTQVSLEVAVMSSFQSEVHKEAECTDLLRGKAMFSDLWDCSYCFGKERKDPRMNKKQKDNKEL